MPPISATSCLLLTWRNQTHFVAHLFSLPLRTESNTKGVYTEDELHAVLTLIYLTVFLDIDPVKSYPLKQATKTVSEQLGRLIETSVGASNGGWFSGGAATGQSDSVSTHGTNTLRGLAKSGLSVADIAWYRVLPTVVAAVPTQGAAVGSLITFRAFRVVQAILC